MVEKKSVKLKEVGKNMQKLLLNVNSGDSLMEKVPDSMQEHLNIAMKST